MRIVLVSCLCILLFSCHDDAGLTPGQPVGEETYGWFSLSIIVKTLIESDRKMEATTCITVRSVPLTDVTLTVSLPSQAKLIKGAPSWKGDLAPKSEKCLPVIFVSKTDLKEWSQPVRAYMEGVYEGKRVKKDETWSYDDYLKQKRRYIEYEEKQ